MRNLTNSEGDIYINTLADGEAIEIVQDGNTTQAVANISMKTNTTQATTLNDTDILIIADGTTGKIVQYITVGDFKTAGTLWSLSTNELYPDSTTYNVVVGTTTNTSGYGIYLFDKDLAIKRPNASASSASLKLIYDNFIVSNSVNSLGNMFWAGATTNYNFDKQLIINTTGAELSNGINTYTLPSANGTIALTTDITTSTNFGTAVPGGNIIRLGNSSNSSQVTNLELYTSASLKIFNTSGVNVATFTPVSNTCDLDLKGGLIKTATLSTNTTWNGGTIAYNYGGTGKSSLTGQTGKVLRVNSNQNGYDFYTIPTATTQYWSEANNTITPLNTSVNKLDIGTHIRLESSGSNHYLTDPNSGAGEQYNYILSYNTASTLSVLNSGSENGECRMTIGGYNRFSVKDSIINCYAPTSITGTLSSTGNLTIGGMLIIGNSNTNLYIKSDNDVVMSYIRNTQQISLEADTAVQGNLSTTTHIDAGNHIRLLSADDSLGYTQTFISDVNSTSTGPTYRVFWNTAGLTTLLNCGSSSGETKLNVGGNERVVANSTGCKIVGELTTLGTTFTTPRFKIATGDSPVPLETWISNPGGDAGDAQKPIIKYHNNGSYLGLFTPAGGTTNGYSIQLSIGTTQKLKIGGASTISYNPLQVVSEFRADSTCYGRYFRIDGTTGYFETYNQQEMYFGTDLNSGSTYFYYSSSAGKMVSSGDWSTFSDERLKTDIQTGDDINKEMADYFDKIDINKYGYIPQYAISKNMTADQRAYGFIAQQVESVYPQGVSNSGKGIFPSEKSDYEPKVELDNVKVISKESINMLLWGKIKDLDKTVKAQQLEIYTLKTENQIYKSIVDKLINATSFKSFKESLV